MIAKLRGILDSFGDGSAVIDVRGVGYLNGSHALESSQLSRDSVLLGA